MVSLAGEARVLDAFGPRIIEELRAGQTLIVDDCRTDRRTARPKYLRTWESIGTRALIVVPLVREGRFAAVLYMHSAAPRRWTELESDLIEEFAGRTWESMQRAQVEEHQRLLIHELSHRVKNTLATVQSVVSQTLRNAANRDEAKEAIEGRLLALSRAHDVLTRENWEGADLFQIVEQAVAAYSSREEDRLHLRGPGVRLPPRMALALAMALQEIATNAVRYGALSNATGAIRIEWSLHEARGEQRLHLVWTESGGPEVREPTRRGFGTRLIERSLAQDLGGKIKVTFAPSGLVCAVDATVPAS